MTTPQNELYRLSDNIKRLTDLFETEEYDEGLFERVGRIDRDTQLLVKQFEMIQDQMRLIIKLLGKE